MSESRQQRRARERAERKASSRPSPDQQSQTAESWRRVEVELFRSDEPEDPTITWHTSWNGEEPARLVSRTGGVLDSQIVESMEMDDDDLEMLVAQTLEAIAHTWPDENIALEWILDEDARAAVDEYGITLLNRHPKR